MGVGLRSFARRVATRLFPNGRSQPSDLASVPLEDLLRQYYAVWLQLHERVNRAVPNIKLRRHGVYSFSDFVLEHIDRNRPVRVLDIGAADCFLDLVLSSEMHRDSTFNCVDVSRSEHLRLSPQVTFVQADALAVLGQPQESSYDYGIASGFLGLLNPEQKHTAFHGLRACKHLFIRENPKVTNVIDAFCYTNLDSYRPWPNAFSERELKDLLASHDFRVEAIEHEYDIYVYATRSGT